MVHEMIHYYLAWNGIENTVKHKKEFVDKANKLNEKYGLNITKNSRCIFVKKTENAPKSI